MIFAASPYSASPPVPPLHPMERGNEGGVYRLRDWSGAPYSLLGIWFRLRRLGDSAPYPGYERLGPTGPIARSKPFITAASICVRGRSASASRAFPKIAYDVHQIPSARPASV